VWRVPLFLPPSCRLSVRRGEGWCESSSSRCLFPLCAPEEEVVAPLSPCAATGAASRVLQLQAGLDEPTVGPTATGVKQTNKQGSGPGRCGPEDTRCAVVVDARWTVFCCSFGACSARDRRVRMPVEARGPSESGREKNRNAQLQAVGVDYQHEETSVSVAQACL
jgi:hypothetical protein